MMLHRIISGFMLVVALGMHAPVSAQDTKDALERLRQQGSSVRVVTPIFSQLLVTSLPQGFEVVSFEKTKELFYIRESVLKGETVDNWSQMISTMGRKDLALKPGATPKAFLDILVEGFKRNCPFSFSTRALSQSPTDGPEVAVAVASCGVAPAKGAANTSESALIAVVKGQVDLYTIQWAERAEPSNVPVPIDVKKWTERFKKLGPIQLCAIVPGERMPYPSCVGSGQRKPV
jgi:hypothetical protein